MLHNCTDEYFCEHCMNQKAGKKTDKNTITTSKDFQELYKIQRKGQGNHKTQDVGTTTEDFPSDFIEDVGCRDSCGSLILDKNEVRENIKNFVVRPNSEYQPYSYAHLLELQEKALKIKPVVPNLDEAYKYIAYIKEKLAKERNSSNKSSSVTPDELEDSEYVIAKIQLNSVENKLRPSSRDSVSSISKRKKKKPSNMKLIKEAEPIEEKRPAQKGKKKK